MDGRQGSSELGEYGRRTRCPALSDPRCSQEDVAMRTALDFSPLYRSTVGFDRLFDMLDGTLGAAEATNANWPPYNIERVSATISTASPWRWQASRRMRSSWSSRRTRS